MKSLSVFCIGVYFTLAACSLDPTLAGRYPVWMYAAFIACQLLFFIVRKMSGARRLRKLKWTEGSDRWLGVVSTSSAMRRN